MKHLVAVDELELGESQDTVAVERGLEGEVEAGQSLDGGPASAHAPVLLAAPPKAVEPDAPGFLPEAVEGAPVVRPAIGAVMAPQDAGIPAMLRG